MRFLNDYKNAGGIVTVGTDSGFIYSTFGFEYIRELELLREAGFHPSEIFRSATYYGAKELFEPSGKPIEFGIIRSGLKADLVVVEENPLRNLKILYGTGAPRLNDQTREVERVQAIRYTIKDGIAYDARQLLSDVRRMVEEAKAGGGR
jgi:imidazolonepropionase-like amidohydrolase